MRPQVKTTDVNEDSMNQKPKFSIVFFEVNVNPLSANPTKWSNTVKQFVGNLPRNCLSVFDDFCEIGA